MDRKYKEKQNKGKTEFLVPSRVNQLVRIFAKTLKNNFYTLEPFRYHEETSPKQSFHVMKEDNRSRDRFCCGSIDLIQKKHDLVLIKLSSTDDKTSLAGEQNQAIMDRVCYLIIQQLIQEGLFLKK